MLQMRIILHRYALSIEIVSDMIHVKMMMLCRMQIRSQMHALTLELTHPFNLLYVLTIAVRNPSSFANTASDTCAPRGTAILPTGSHDLSSDPN